MTVGWIFAGLGLIFGGFAARDVLAKNVGLIFVDFRRADRPIVYWFSVIAEMLVATLCAFIALAALLYPADCDANGNCSITVQLEAQAQ